MKLKRFNDWGSLYYAEEGKGLRDGFASKRLCGLLLTDGQEVGVTWPDGSTSIERLASRDHVERVGDMGHDYDVTSKEYGFNVDVRGVTAWTPIEAVDVMIDVVEV